MWRWLAARDPRWFALRRAVKAAVVVPANFAIGAEAIGNPQVATFAAFGSFALLLFTNFTGSLATRAAAYLTLAGAGVVLISVGTALATPDWLAVASMAVVTFAVLFAGGISSMIGAGAQAALLGFILAVMLPSVRADVPSRLAGWGIAVAVCLPVALFVWPPRDQDQLRVRAAALCRAMAVMLDLDQPATTAGDRLVAMRSAARELRATFSSSATRTAGLSTGARLLIRLVDELEWLSITVVNACADAPEQWPANGQALRSAAAAVLCSAGDTLDYPAGGPDPRVCASLEVCLAELEHARAGVAREALSDLRAGVGPTDGGGPRGEFERPLYAAHELGYVVALAGHTVGLIAAADSRPWWAKLTGRRVTADELGSVQIVRRATGDRLNRHSVSLQNSVRGGVGLALAVLLSRVVDAQNAFWIGLGALSVLRSNALSTGSTAARALLGTVVGFAVGGALVAVLGTSHAVLWPLLPVVILVAALAPAVISFEAGQAGFTLLVIILFNIIAPAGWRIGVLRIEDVALGCLASFGAGLLFWPRGAGAALSLALGDAYGSAAEYLREAVTHLTGARPNPPELGGAAVAAGQRLDDALRQYLAERGSKQVPLPSVAALANGAARVRLAATAIKHLHGDASDDHAVHEQLEQPAAILQRRTERVADWYATLARRFADPRREPPGADGAGGEVESFLEVVLPVVGTEAAAATHAEQLLWSGQYVGDVEQLRPSLLEPAAQVAAARARPWWRP